MELEKQKRALIKGGYWLGVLGATLLAVLYLLPLLLPFIWGLVIAWLLQPAAGFIYRHSGIGKRGSAIMAATVLYVILGLALWVAGSFVVVRGEQFFHRLPDLYEGQIAPFLQEMQTRLGTFARRFSQGGQPTGQIAGAVSGMIQEALQSVSVWGMELLGTGIKKLPMSALGLVFTILSSVLFCAEYHKVTGFLMEQIPQEHRKTVLETRDFLTVTVVKLLRAYSLLTLVAWVILIGGLAILKVKGFVGVSIGIALLDLLPVIGSGVVLVPWGIWALLGGDVFLGVGLLVLWAVVSTVKQVLEPKFVGDQIGLNPIISLMAMYIGLRLGGFWGLLVAPVLCLTAQHLQRQSVIRLYR